MFFDEIPVVTLGQFLNPAVDLFGAVARMIFDQPALLFFAAVAIFLTVITLFAWLVRQGRSGRL